MKTLNTVKKSNIALVVLVCLSLALVAGCSRRGKSTQSELAAPPMQGEPTVIELGDSRLSDMLKEGDIPEEDRGDLPWLPKRPPRGMQFEQTSALQVVYFEFDKFTLTTQTRNALDQNAAWLKNNPEISVQIEGHCDERGTLEYNQVLGENRTLAVKKYLAALGIDPNRLYTISYGETVPADSGHTEDAWAKNRRAQFKISR